MNALVFIIIVVTVYMLPTMIGYRKKNANAICIVNLFLGWTFLGWVLALAMAVWRE